MLRTKFNKLFFPHDNKTHHLKALDGLRAIAVLFVMLSHSSNDDLYFHEYINFGQFGKVGVYLFFVLSAYLLDRQIVLALINNKGTRQYWKNYFLRRFLRIYPLFFIALVLYGSLSALGFTTTIDEVADIPMHMLLLKGESIFWSIPVEFKYYFISPLIMLFCHYVLKWDRLKVVYTFLFIIVLTIAMELVLHWSIISTLRYFPIFMVGTFISTNEVLYQNDKIMNVKSKSIDLMGVFCFMLILITIPYYFEKIFNLKVNFQLSEFYFPYALAWGLILISAKYGKGFIKKLLEFKFLRFIGSISFSIYLFHMLFLQFVVDSEMPHNLKIYVFFILSIIFSSVSFLIFERPLSKIRIKDSNSKLNN